MISFEFSSWIITEFENAIQSFIFGSNLRRILRKNEAIVTRITYKFCRTKNDDIKHGKISTFYSCNEYLSREQSVLGLHIKGEVSVCSASRDGFRQV